jgi:hypothetical protein
MIFGGGSLRDRVITIPCSSIGCGTIFAPTKAKVLRA